MNRARTKSTLFIAVAVILTVVSFMLGVAVGWLGKTQEAYEWTKSGQIEAAFNAAQQSSIDTCNKNANLKCSDIKIESISDISSAELSPDGSLRYSFNYLVASTSNSEQKNITVIVSGSGKVLETTVEAN